jgi:outer membrane protein OmpA-like peptidoglycan-associated protein
LKLRAREKLAKVVGILLAYPGLNIEVGGYTDNVGGDALSLTLSVPTGLSHTSCHNPLQFCTTMLN